jgi:guanine deaminase
MTDTDERWLAEAVALAEANVGEGGGPFGAVVVRDGVALARGQNRVTRDLDPTAHAEVVAIRSACRNLESFQLTGCIVYTSCEPCPMCLGAIYWARPSAIFFAGTREDAAAAGFDDELFYDELDRPNDERQLKMVSLLRDEAQQVFENWNSKADKVEY